MGDVSNINAEKSNAGLTVINNTNKFGVEWYPTQNDSYIISVGGVGKVFELTNIYKTVSDWDGRYVVKVTNDNFSDLTAGYNGRTLNNAGELFFTEAGMNKFLRTTRSEKAEEYQEWLDFELVPTIRKTGEYSIKSKDEQLNEIVKMDEDLLVKIILEKKALRLELEKKEAENKKLELEKVYTEKKYCLIPSDIGKMYDKSARKINLVLEELGLQVNRAGEWVLTEEGKKYGRYLDLEIRMGNVSKKKQYLKWSEDVYEVSDLYFN
jgi:prophage antirepressor-like protein